MKRRNFVRGFLGAVSALPLLRWLPERFDAYRLRLRELSPHRPWASDVSEHGNALWDAVNDRLMGEIKVTISRDEKRGSGWEEVERVEHTIIDRSKPEVPRELRRPRI